MKSSKPFEPDWVSCPGQTIQEIIDEEGASHRELAKALGMNEIDVLMLLAGELIITQDIASRLSISIGSNAEYWLNRESNYRRHLSRIKQNNIRNIKN